MRSKQIHEGYVMIDHRASPGLSKEEAIALGYEPQHVAEGQLFEAKTNHCNHCGTVVIINPLRTRERSYCSSCDKYICDNCGISLKLPDYVHKTYQQQLEEGHTFYSNQGNII